MTGTRAKTEARVEGLISSLREATDKAICVGFGVSGPDQVRGHHALKLVGSGL